MTREVPKKTRDELIKVLGEAKLKFKEGTMLRHKSGDKYIVKGYSIDCKTNKVLVLYQKYDWNVNWDFIIFSRPIEDFVEPRFTPVKLVQMYLSDEEYKEYRSKNTNGFQ